MSALRSLLSAPRLPILRRYFYSGWAFLIPYLVVYLLYYVTKWPVNAAISNQRPEAGSQMTVTWVPCMLHVYWVLHAIHVILAGFALWSWLASYRSENQDPRSKCQEPDCATPDLATSDDVVIAPGGHPLHQPSADAPGEPLNTNRASHHLRLSAPSGLWPLAIRLAPWALLALLFYIPGVYLEWPSDPWEHLRRINEWRVLDTVGAHSSWSKSAYFIPYSLLSWCIGLRQLFWLDFYYTGICLLLCWQYYKLSRACGLGERASMVFVIIQALLFGNNIFSFYRYYGISSSIYAQLGAIAFTRIFLEWAARGTKFDPNHCRVVSQRQMSSDTEPAESAHEARDVSARTSTPLAHVSDTILPNPFQAPLTSYLQLTTAVACLLALTAFNHPQGIGIAGLGIMAIIVWRLIEWKRSALWWWVGGAVLVNIIFLCLYLGHPVVKNYQAQGLLTFWGGFNLFNPFQVGGDRTLQIIAVPGILSISAALLLLRRNHPAAWITITPFIILSFPCCSLPFANIVAKHADPSHIVTFQRLLFALPIGLTPVTFLSRLQSKHLFLFKPFNRCLPIPPGQLSGNIVYFLACTAFAAVIIATPSRPLYNRLWHSLTIHPRSLDLKNLLLGIDPQEALHCRVVAPSIGSALYSFGTVQQSPELQFRANATPSTTAASNAVEFIAPPVINQALPGANAALPGTNLLNRTALERPEGWITHGGAAPVVLSDAGTHTIRNPAGKECYPFTAEMVPVDPRKAYLVEISVRAIGANPGVVYLGVAWSDQNKSALFSNQSSPQGAGFPRGWVNGTFSYFGLVNAMPPHKSTKFRQRFGYLTDAAIPANARFIRIGALLNHENAPDAQFEISELALSEIKPDTVRVITPSYLMLTHPYSQAALHSMHWPPQQVAVDYGGSREVAKAFATFPKEYQ